MKKDAKNNKANQKRKFNSNENNSQSVDTELLDDENSIYKEAEKVNK